MSIEFNDENQMMYNQIRQTQQAGSSSKFNQFLVSKGIASNEDQANKVLLGIAILAVALTIFVIFKYII